MKQHFTAVSDELLLGVEVFECNALGFQKKDHFIMVNKLIQRNFNTE